MKIFVLKLQKHLLHVKVSGMLTFGLHLFFFKPSFHSQTDLLLQLLQIQYNKGRFNLELV